MSFLASESPSTTPLWRCCHLFVLCTEPVPGIPSLRGALGAPPGSERGRCLRAPLPRLPRAHSAPIPVTTSLPRPRTDHGGGGEDAGGGVGPGDGRHLQVLLPERLVRHLGSPGPPRTARRRARTTLRAPIGRAAAPCRCSALSLADCPARGRRSALPLVTLQRPPTTPRCHWPSGQRASAFSPRLARPPRDGALRDWAVSAHWRALIGCRRACPEAALGRGGKAAAAAAGLGTVPGHRPRAQPANASGRSGPAASGNVGEPCETRLPFPSRPGRPGPPPPCRWIPWSTRRSSSGSRPRRACCASTSPSRTTSSK